MKCSGLLLIAMCLSATVRASDPPKRQVAITIDDLPAGAASSMSAAAIRDMTAKMLQTLSDRKIPVVGFVNEKRVYEYGEVDERLKALKMWVDFGFELGNHTYSHSSLNRVGLRAWEDDVVQGEPLIKLLLAQEKLPLKYFRHPYLDTGRDIETRREAESFLTQRGYQIAPVTLDAWDWMYAPVYDDAKKRGDHALEQEIVKSYLSYSDSVFGYSEQLSVKTIGYEPRQILLLHANQLEADHIGDLLDLMRRRGYSFITLADALSDPAYGLPDTYVGVEGTGWLDHWAVTQGHPPEGAPVFPQWVIDRARPLRQSQ